VERYCVERQDLAELLGDLAQVEIWDLPPTRALRDRRDVRSCQYAVTAGRS
jgi:hypothetical protein